MSERDELAAAIMEHPWLDKSMFTGKSGDAFRGLCPSCPERVIAGGHNSPSHAGHIADAILAAGYRRPRTVTTVSELDALPVGSVIRTSGVEDECEPRVAVKTAFWKSESEWFTADDSEWCLSSDELDDLPATVLHEPEATK